MSEYRSVAETAKHYNVTEQCVRLWLKNGLPCKYEKRVGVKTRRIINQKDVKTYLKVGVRKNK